MSNTITANQQPEHKDRLFKYIFGKDSEKSKMWRLQLYNALNGTDYKNPDALELNTIENVIYITMHNDISFLVDSQMTLYEQQSTWNPNMPLRGLLYFSQLYQIYLTQNDENVMLLNELKEQLSSPDELFNVYEQYKELMTKKNEIYDNFVYNKIADVEKITYPLFKSASSASSSPKLGDEKSPAKKIIKNDELTGYTDF